MWIMSITFPWIVIFHRPQKNRENIEKKHRAAENKLLFYTQVKRKKMKYCDA